MWCIISFCRQVLLLKYATGWNPSSYSCRSTWHLQQDQKHQAPRQMVCCKSGNFNTGVSHKALRRVTKHFRCSAVHSQVCLELSKSYQWCCYHCKLWYKLVIIVCKSYKLLYFFDTYRFWLCCNSLGFCRIYCNGSTCNQVS